MCLYLLFFECLLFSRVLLFPGIRIRDFGGRYPTSGSRTLTQESSEVLNRRSYLNKNDKFDSRNE